MKIIKLINDEGLCSWDLLGAMYFTLIPSAFWNKVLNEFMSILGFITSIQNLFPLFKWVSACFSAHSSWEDTCRWLVLTTQAKSPTKKQKRGKPQLNPILWLQLTKKTLLTGLSFDIGSIVSIVHLYQTTR